MPIKSYYPWHNSATLYPQQTLSKNTIYFQVNQVTCLGLQHAPMKMKVNFEWHIFFFVFVFVSPIDLNSVGWLQSITTSLMMNGLINDIPLEKHQLMTLDSGPEWKIVETRALEEYDSVRVRCFQGQLVLKRCEIKCYWSERLVGTPHDCESRATSSSSISISPSFFFPSKHLP